MKTSDDYIILCHDICRLLIKKMRGFMGNIEHLNIRKIANIYESN
jgi:hypothetical protein